MERHRLHRAARAVPRDVCGEQEVAVRGAGHLARGLDEGDKGSFHEEG